jgi:ATP-dependent DNA ligase
VGRTHAGDAQSLGIFTQGVLFEPKLDGVRCLAQRAGDRVELISRNEKSMNDKYPELFLGLRFVKEAHEVVRENIGVQPTTQNKAQQ